MGYQSWSSIRHSEPYTTAASTKRKIWKRSLLHRLAYLHGLLDIAAYFSFHAFELPRVVKDPDELCIRNLEDFTARTETSDFFMI